MNYTFIASDADTSRYPAPKPASKFIPEWYQKMPNARDPATSIPSTKLTWSDPAVGVTNGQTLKQCIPVRDYLTSGYIVPLWTELVVTLKNGKLGAVWPDKDADVIRFHYNFQFTGCPIEKENADYSAVGKLMSPWQFKTPKGYSSLFYSPRYSENKIEILPAIVDTDCYHEVNFPFIFHGKEGEHLFEKGTPVIQVLPFKREKWTADFEIGTPTKTRQILNTVFTSGYRKFFHSKKIFR